MFTPIHRALGLEPGNISIDLLAKAVEHSVEETGDLDWKRVAYDSRRPGWDEEAAKDIAAMANSGGGWIVFGIEEDGDKNAASKIVPISWSATDQQRILRAAYAKIGPPVVGLDFHEVPCGSEGGGSVVMMRVPDSADAPHFARKGDNAFVAPRRNGPHTVYMSDREIERGFRERFSNMQMIRNASFKIVTNVHARGCTRKTGYFLLWLPFLMSLSLRRDRVVNNVCWSMYQTPACPSCIVRLMRIAGGTLGKSRKACGNGCCAVSEVAGENVVTVFMMTRLY